MIGARVGIYSGKGLAFETEYQYLLDYWTSQGYTLPSATNQGYQNQFIKNLKGLEDGITGSANLLTKLERAWIGANENQNLAKTDWVTAINNAGASAYELTLVNSPTFTSNEGWAGNGTSSYMHWGTNYIDVDLNGGFYSYARSNFNNGWNFGHSAGVPYGIETATQSAAYINRNGGDLTRFPTGPWTNGRFLANRESSTVVKAYRNQTLGTLTAQTGTSTQRQPTYLCRNIGALGTITPLSYSTVQLSCNIAFNGMSEAECFQLDDAFQLYMTNLGKAI